MSKIGSIGIDIGGTKTRFALFDEEFKIVEDIKIKTQDSKDAKDYTHALQESLNILVKKAEKRKLTFGGVGIGCAGSSNADGTIRDSPNIPFLKKFPLRSVVSKITSSNVIVVNDVDAGLYGEYQFGAAMGVRHVIGVFIGTGIGGALILDGKLYRGAGGHAGDIGHYLLQPMGPLAGSDRHGILDDVASRTAIAGEAATLAAKQWAPQLLKLAGTDVTNISSGVLAEAVTKGDKKIEELVRSRAHIIGIVLSNIVDFLNPEMIVLGGGLTEAMPGIIRDEVEAGVFAHCTEEAKDGLKIVTSKLKDHAATMGAAKLAIDISAQ